MAQLSYRPNLTYLGRTSVVGPGVREHREPSITQEANASTEPGDDKLVGPVLGPPRPSSASGPTNGAASRASSPYSLNRSLVRDLTLPPVPNLDIPPSPPGSPSPSTTAKFAHFVELKKQGVHFNEKLARSSALKNPNLFQKLTRFAGIDENDEYASTLPKEMWDPTAFPAWAYKEELAKSQQEITKRKEEESMRTQRDALDFVPASSAAGDSSRATSAGGAAGRMPGKSAAERVMAGLDRGRTKSPYPSDTDKRRIPERRGGWFDGYRGRERSRSPGRRR